MQDNKKTDIDIRRLASLCHLDLSDDEAAFLTAELKKMADYIYPHLVCGNISAPIENSNTLDSMREDLPCDSGITAEILSAAPDTEGGHIRVPRVVENGGSENE